MSGNHPYAAGSLPHYTHNSSDPSGPGQMFVQPLSPENSGPQSVQNGPFGGPRQQQFPPLGGPVGYQASGGAHPAGFLPPPGSAGSHPQNSRAVSTPTTQFKSMTLSDQGRANFQPGIPPGMPPSSGHINGPSPGRGTNPPSSIGIGASNSMAPPTNMMSRTSTGSFTSNLGYPTSSAVAPPSSLSSGVPSLVGGLPTQSSAQSLSIRATNQPSSDGRPQLPSIGKSMQPTFDGGPLQPSFIGGFTPPSNVGHQQSSLSSSARHQQDRLHEQVPPSAFQPQQHQQFQTPPSASIHGVSLHQGQSSHAPPSASMHDVPPHQGQPIHSLPSGSVHGVVPHQGQSIHPPPPGSLHGMSPHQGQSIHPPPPGSAHGVPPHQGQFIPPPGSVHGVPPHQGQSFHPPPPGSVQGVPPYQGQSIHPPPPGSVQGVPPHQGQSTYPPPPGSAHGVPPHQGQSIHPQQNTGPAPFPPGQGQISPPYQTGGQFPGSVSNNQQFSGYPGQQPPPAQPPQQPSPVQQKRLDPDQMPSPIQVIEDDKKNRSGVYQTNTRGSAPPLVTTNFFTQDQGNASPRYIRSTMYNIPCTADLLKSSHIPFALVLTPFAELEDREQPPPLVDLGELGPVRCKRCKAYMCSFMQFIDGGRRFQCPFCNAVTDVPNEYFAHLDHTGRRVDCFNRPELCLGSYEFVATKDYCKNGVPPKEPAFIFMIDVSYSSMKSGLVNLICDKIKSEILVHLRREVDDEESEIRVGFVTYHKELHFYNVKNSLAQPQMMVVSDLEDMFVPVIDGFLVKLSESEALIDSLLTQIPHLFAESKETELVLGPVIQAGLDALRSADRAGRLYIFHTGLPTLEAPGKLKNRDDQKLLGTDKEKSILTPQTNFYSKLGAECVAAGCSVDLFLFPNQYIDMATLSDICKVTAGNIFKYSYFQADLDGERFLEDLKTSVKRSQAFDAILRVRTSTGIRPVDFYGNFYMANTTDIEMAAADSDSSVCVELKHDDKLSETEGAYVQVAVLYTSVTGQRILRCHNLSLNCSSQLTDIFRNCELDTLINCFSKQALKMCLNTNPRHVREHFTNEVAQILACYRKNCTNQSSPGQLVLPECMKLLPVYANCVIKNDSVSGSSEISSDDRSYLMHLVNRMDVKTSQVFFYPRLLPVHNLDLKSDELPVAIRCSVEKLEDSGIYILENGLSLFLWIGQNASNDLVQKIFGVSSAAQIDIDKAQLLKLDNPVSRRLCDLIAKIRKERSRYLKLIFVRHRDKLQPWFEHFLVEDKGLNSSSSYVDFLLHIHKEIRNILS